MGKASDSKCLSASIANYRCQAEKVVGCLGGKEQFKAMEGHVKQALRDAGDDRVGVKGAALHGGPQSDGIQCVEIGKKRPIPSRRFSDRPIA